jgi:hypothetical protein
MKAIGKYCGTFFDAIRILFPVSLIEWVKFNFLIWLLFVLYTLATMYCYIDKKATVSRARNGYFRLYKWRTITLKYDASASVKYEKFNFASV